MVSKAPRSFPMLSGRGTSEAYWRSCPRLESLPPWRVPALRSGRVVIVSPHPDDEVLGVGGTLMNLAAQGASLLLVAVTDGEHSHPGRASELRAIRPRESAAAFNSLGLTSIEAVRLCVPDGSVEVTSLVPRLSELVRADDLVLAPWSHDGHPDHDAVGVAAAVAADKVGADLWAYLVWAWHWMQSDDVPWAGAVRVNLAGAALERKREAVSCFHSQLEGSRPILPSYVLDRLTRSFEVLVHQ